MNRHSRSLLRLMNQANNLRLFITLILTLQLALAPLANSWAADPQKPQSPQNPNNSDQRQGPTQSTDQTPAQSQIEQTANELVSEGLQSDSFKQTAQQIENLAEQIDASSENKAPENTPNLFYLGFQELIYENKTYDLSRSNLGLPTIAFDPQKVDNEVDIVADRANQTLSFIYNKSGKEIARHIIKKIDVVSFAKHATEVQLLTRDGHVHAIPMGFARSHHVLFKSPIPIFLTGTVPEEILPQIDNIELHYLTRGLKPPERINPAATVPLDYHDKFTNQEGPEGTVRKIFSDSAVLSARPLFMTIDSGRELIAVHVPEVTQSYINMGIATLANLAYAISPQGQADGVLGLMADGQVAQAVAQAESRLNGGPREALSAFSPKLIDLLIGRMSAMNSQLREPRDRFTFAEWRTDFEKMAARAQAEQNDMGRDWQTLIAESQQAEEAAITQQPGEDTQAAANTQSVYKKMWQKLVSSGALKILGVLVAVDATAITAHEYGGLLIDGMGPDWAVHIAASIYEMLPPVLKDSAYRVTMFKGMHAISSLILINFAVGTIMGKFKNWDFKKSLATIGVRIAAQLQFSFLGRLTQLTRQSTFMRALQNGMSPFRKIRANSAVGHMANLQSDLRPGLINPFSFGSSRTEQINIRNRVIEAKATIDQRKRALAMLISNLVIAEKLGVDPMMILLAKQGLISEGDLTKTSAELKQILANPAFTKAAHKIAREISALLENSAILESDIADLDAKTILAEVTQAKEIAEKMLKRSDLAQLLNNLKLSWQELVGGQALKTVGEFGQEQHEFLKHVDVSPFVSNQAWTQFWTDFLFTVVQIPLVGDRANLAKPHELAHSENHFAWNSPGHNADMANQYAIYGISVPARLTQTFGDKYLDMREKRFDPIEYMTLNLVEKREGFLTSTWGWAKSATNLRQANYAHYSIKDILRRLKSIQLVFIMDFTTRVLIAGQNVSAAIPAFLCFLVGAEAGYAWPWKPIVRGQQLAQDTLSQRNARLKDAQTVLGQGLRLNDAQIYSQGAQKLLAIYNEYGDIGENARRTLIEAEKILALPPQEWAATESIMSQALGPIVRLHIALESKDKNQIQAAHNELRTVYANAGQVNGTSNEIGNTEDAIKQINAFDAKSLLEYSLKNPPFNTNTHPAVGVILNVFGSFITTYMGTNMFVDLLRDHSWSVKMLEWGAIAGLFYASLYFGQKVVNNIGATLDYVRLRKELPVEAFANAYSAKKTFVSLSDYVDWLQSNANAPELLKSMPKETVETFLRDYSMKQYGGEKKFIARLNKQAVPSVNDITSCAALIKDGQVVPLTRAQKARALWRGLFRSPVK